MYILFLLGPLTPCSDPSTYNPPAFFEWICLNKNLCLWLYNQLAIAEFQIVDPPYQPVFLPWKSALPKWGKTAIVLEIKFAVVVRRETVDGLEALLEWLKKVFLRVLSSPEVITLMLFINSGIDPLSCLSFPLAMTKSWFSNSQSTVRTLFLVQDLTHNSSNL